MQRPGILWAALGMYVLTIRSEYEKQIARRQWVEGPSEFANTEVGEGLRYGVFDMGIEILAVEESCIRGPKRITHIIGPVGNALMRRDERPRKEGLGVEGPR